ncbi:unnamed protein product [marine sediment metagenome]|uniref:Uncharacterized protein n=1 Tax=marine sediment metagenome TaxID=412755 RepID=X0Z2F8_9ZZZZ
MVFHHEAVHGAQKLCDHEACHFPILHHLIRLAIAYKERLQ